MLLCREDTAGLHHAQIYLRASSEALAQIFGVLKKAGANVLRYQLRPMPETTSKQHFGAEEEAHKLDMTFEFETQKSAKVSERLGAISIGLSNLPRDSGGPLVVHSSSWSAPNAEIRDKTAVPAEERVRKPARTHIKTKQKGARRAKSGGQGNRRSAAKGGS
jgi:hypothetical protein